jgi:hypothetical protein
MPRISSKINSLLEKATDLKKKKLAFRKGHGSLAKKNSLLEKATDL